MEAVGEVEGERRDDYQDEDSVITHTSDERRSQ
jgi:hypothetical protein